VTAGDAASYDCVATNACGSATSAAAVLTVNTPPSFATQPPPAAACPGGSATFTLAVSGSPAPSLQRRKDSVTIPGATSPSLTISPVGLGDAASYDCVATNACGPATSTAAALTVNAAPAITTQPAPTSACPGGSASFTLGAAGSPAPTFQWRKNSVN